MSKHFASSGHVPSGDAVNEAGLSLGLALEPSRAALLYNLEVLGSGTRTTKSRTGDRSTGYDLVALSTYQMTPSVRDHWPTKDLDS